MMMMGAAGGGSRYPFTASQWQELELQALVFKYMVSGIPVPSDLILCIRRSLFMDPQTLPFLPNPPPTIGWGAYQVTDARKAVDPEPGRCRRTDGKKWRCSKDAYPDSKYCERHMHRGKSRSRKPVELSLATSPASSSSSSPHYSNFPPPSPPPPPHLSLSTPPPPPPPQTHHFLLSCSSSSSRTPPAAAGMVFSSLHDDSSGFCLDSLPHTVDHYRSMLGFKEGVSEYPFLSSMPCSFGPMEMSSKKSYGSSSLQGTDPHFRMCSGREEEKKPYFLLGADHKTEKAAANKLDWEREEQQQHHHQQQPTQNARPFHCFLDEKPPKIEGSWMRGTNVDLKTQLSISIPMANQDIPVTASQCYNDG